MTAKPAKKTANKASQTDKSARLVDHRLVDHRLVDHGTALDRCYGQIGISAVAAAVRYQGGGKNPAYAPVANRWDDRIEAA
jgi:hypothetical protein